MADGIRRVVTTHAGDGKAVILSDGIATNAKTRSSGITGTLLWTTDSMPVTYSNRDRGEADRSHDRRSDCIHRFDSRVAVDSAEL